MAVWTAKKVKGLRARLGDTQPAFAARLGVEESTLRKWEYGLNVPSKTAQILMDCLAAGQCLPSKPAARKPRPAKPKSQTRAA